MSLPLRLLPGAFFLGAAVLLAAPAGNRPPAGKTDWPLFRGNPQQTGVSASPLPDRLAELWSFRIEDAFENAAAVSGGVVYAGAMDEHLYALDLASGRLKWKYKGGPFKSAPAFRGGSVYAGDLDGLLHCVDAARGVKRWTFETGAEVGGINFAGDDVLFASHDENLYCVNRDGALVWKFKTDGPIYGAPAVAHGKTFLVGCDSQMHVLDVTKGKEIRATHLGGQTSGSACVAGDHLYIGTMRNEVKAINWKTGAVSWTFKPRRPQSFNASPAATDKYVVIGCRDSRVYGLERQTGKQAWSFLTGGHVDASPVIAAGRVVVGSMDKNLYVLDLATGKLLQKVPLDGPVSASAVVVEGKVIVGTQKGTLYCFGAKK
jgi:outer membrane protein assembly factor BamB